jgi:4-amino-4-deoxy-L-arabinose transferase-like glycosyltransferase
MSDPRAPYAWRSVGIVALALLVLLLTLAGRYGYHRDELYFLAAGRHLDWGYVDQPPLTPLLSRGMSVLVGDSLAGARILPAVLAVATVLVAGLISRELGGGRAEQLLTAGATAISAVVLIGGHWLSTTTVDLLVWAVLCWSVIRGVRTGGGPVWLWAGSVAGLGLQNKTLVLFLLAALVAGLLLAGPRRAFRDPWWWAAGGLALLIWTPNLIWQATHGWPQLELSAAIADGSSGSSQPWWLFVPFQLVLVSPGLVPVWVAGLVVLLRSADLRPYRFLAVAYLMLVGVFLLTGGKPYYVAGLYPVLLAAGSLPTLRWLRAGRGGRRPGLLGLAFVLSLPNLVLMLPLLPERLLGPVVAVNYDAGETVGWPRFAATVGDVYGTLPAAGNPVVITGNYGEAGALERFRPGVPVYSGHNAYADWGPPPDSVRTAVIVGLPRERIERWCGDLVEVARIDNQVGLDNDEQGAPVWACRSLTQPWSKIWPQLRRLG